MKTLFSILLFVLVATFSNLGEPAAADKMEWWTSTKFGMFIHWGIYAVPARGEWVMNYESIPVKKYEKFAAQFDPVGFDADEWVRIAKEAGQKYLVITAKHHDGFCMWDSQITDYDVVDRTPFKRDVIRELSEACRRADIGFGVYYSILDWHQPDARAGNIEAYRDEYLVPQVRELIENYHPDILWFDGEWQHGWTEGDAKALYELCVSLNPRIIVNDRIMRTMAGAGDYVTPEQSVPEEPPAGPWESCMTMNANWGYRADDQYWKTPQTLVNTLVEVVSGGGNLLLNVGPTAEGIIPVQSVQTLRSMGEWLRLYGATIYGSTRSPIQGFESGHMTYKQGVYYLHLSSMPADRKVEIPLAVTGSAQAFDYKTGKALHVTVGSGSVTIDLTGVEEDPYATVIGLKP